MDLLPKNYKKAPGRASIKIAKSRGFGLPVAKKEPTFLSSKKLMVVCLVLLILALGLWGGLLFYKKIIEKKIIDIKEQIITLEKERDPQIIEKIVFFEKGISNLKKIISEHKYTSKIFALLEENTIPQVAWNSFDFDDKDGNISLSGLARSYSYIAKQIVAFKNSSLNKVEVSDMKLSKESGVEFSVKLGLDPGILLKK